MAIRPVVPAPYDRSMNVECGGVIIPRKTELLWERTVSVPACPLWTPHGMPWYQTNTFAV